jgi:transposase-like protein
MTPAGLWREVPLEEEQVDALIREVFLACPQAHRKAARTTNAIERALREVRR